MNLFRVNPDWVQGEVNRLTENGPSPCDVIIGSARKGGMKMNILKKAAACIGEYIKSNENAETYDKVYITEYPAGVALRNW